MQTVTTDFTNAITSDVRTCRGKVELYTDSTLTNTYNYNDYLQEIEIQRIGTDSRFFGFSICQRLHIKLRDKDRELTISAGQKLKPYIGVVLIDASISYIPYPSFTITEVNRDENDNHLEITAYDCIADTDKLTVADLNLTAPYTVQQFGNAIATKLGMSAQFIGVSSTILALSYTTGANLDGTEKLRDVLNALAEITTSIVYISYDGKLTFKTLLPSATTDLNITKAQYFTLDSKTNRRLSAITHASELGNNLTATLDTSGTTQVIRENPFLNLRSDADVILTTMLGVVGGLTINQFDCEWRGNPAIEIGDKITLTTKDNNTAASFILNDTIKYNVDGLSEQTSWQYSTEIEEISSNPTTIGEKVKQTIAIVDKQKQEITLLAQDVASNSSQISINTKNIASTISAMETNNNTINTKITALDQTASNINVSIKSIQDNGVSKVVTETGFTFDANGLTVNKTGSEMSTNIDEDGMSVKRDNTEVLTADSAGVNALNLISRQYLVIGDNARFENYQSNRTGCFYIGG